MSKTNSKNADDGCTRSMNVKYNSVNAAVGQRACDADLACDDPDTIFTGNLKILSDFYFYV